MNVNGCTASAMPATAACTKYVLTCMPTRADAFLATQCSRWLGVIGRRLKDSQVGPATIIKCMCVGAASRKHHQCVVISPMPSDVSHTLLSPVDVSHTVHMWRRWVQCGMVTEMCGASHSHNVSSVVWSHMMCVSMGWPWATPSTVGSCTVDGRNPAPPAGTTG